MTPERLAEIERLANEATPGPWEWDLDVFNEDGEIESCVGAGIPIAMLFRAATGLKTTTDGNTRETWHKAEKAQEAIDAAYIAAANPAALLDLIAHIRDLEAPPKCARGCDRDGVGSPCIHELSPDELTGVADHIRDLEAQVREAREVPSIDDCLYHRCVEHWTVPGRNTTASSNGAECGACIERDWRSAFENYATHHGWCASGHGGMHVLGSPGSCDCGRDARLATTTPPSPEVGA